MRIGYGIVSPSLALQVQDNLPPWTVNSLAQAVGGVTFIVALGATLALVRLLLFVAWTMQSILFRHG